MDSVAALAVVFEYAEGNRRSSLQPLLANLEALSVVEAVSQDAATEFSGIFVARIVLSTSQIQRMGYLDQNTSW
jgi:hypothetical protein